MRFIGNATCLDFVQLDLQHSQVVFIPRLIEASAMKRRKKGGRKHADVGKEKASDRNRRKGRGQKEGRREKWMQARKETLNPGQLLMCLKVHSSACVCSSDYSGLSR